MKGLIVVVLFSVLGCVRAPKGTEGGVSVGNGMQSYQIFYSETFHFSVTYPSQIPVVKKGVDHVMWGAQTPGNSGLAFTVEDTTEVVASPEAMKSYVETKHRIRTQSLHEPGGLPGVYAETRDADSIKGVYYFLPPKSEMDLVSPPEKGKFWNQGRYLLRFELVAYTHDGGVALLPPVVRTLRYDGTPPEIKRVRLVSNRVSEKEGLSLEVEASDLGSGIVGGRLVATFNHANRRRNMVTHAVTISGQPGADGLFRFSFPLQRKMESGPYFLTVLSVSDVAGNRRFLFAKKSEKDGLIEYPQGEANWAGWSYSLTDEEGNSVPFSTPLVRVDVDNPNGDATAPRLKKVGLKESRVTIDKKDAALRLTVEIEAEDEKSGLVGGSVRIVTYPVDGLDGALPSAVDGTVFTPSGFQTIVKLHPFTDAKSGETTVGTVAILVGEGSLFPYRLAPISAGDVVGGKISVPLPVSAYLRAGSYRLTAEVADAAGNWTDSSDPIEFEVHNTVGADETPPSLSSVKVVPCASTPGYCLEISATDDRSGVKGGMVYAAFQPEGAAAVSSEIVLLTSVRAQDEVSPGTYRFPLSCHPYLKAGTYRLSALGLKDRAGRTAWLYGRRHGRGPFSESLRLDGGGSGQKITSLPTPQLEIHNR